jgi:hypothetical protein
VGKRKQNRNELLAELRDLKARMLSLEIGARNQFGNIHNHINKSEQRVRGGVSALGETIAPDRPSGGTSTRDAMARVMARRQERDQTLNQAATTARALGQLADAGMLEIAIVDPDLSNNESDAVVAQIIASMSNGRLRINVWDKEPERFPFSGKRLSETIDLTNMTADDAINVALGEPRSADEYGATPTGGTADNG